MTHSDLYKPQGISATRNISYVNVHPNMTLGHVVANTGASRYFNFVDYDGSATGSAVPTIVGSHSDWWYISHSCRKQWGVWVCPKESKLSFRPEFTMQVTILQIFTSVWEPIVETQRVERLFGLATQQYGVMVLIM